jgi:hypothetical protein
MRLKLVYGIGIDLPAFEAGKLRYRELSRHRQHLRACDYCFSHRCWDAPRVRRGNNWKHYRARQAR